MKLSSKKSKNGARDLVHQLLQQIQNEVTAESRSTSGLVDPLSRTSTGRAARQRQKLAIILDEAITIAVMMSSDPQEQNNCKCHHQSTNL